MDIVKYTLSSNLLAVNYRATYISYMSRCKMMITYVGVLTFLVKLDKDCTVSKTLGFTHLNDQSLYSSSKVDIFLMIRVANAFVKSNHKPSAFRANLFCIHARAFLDDLRFLQLEQDREELPIFALLLYTKTQQPEIISVLITSLFNIGYSFFRHRAKG